MELRCPTCKKPISEGKAAPTFPFCSPRCKLADLGSWLSGRYVVAGAPTDAADDLALGLDDAERLAMERGRGQESS